jgi:hypothetical protein
MLKVNREYVKDELTYVKCNQKGLVKSELNQIKTKPIFVQYIQHLHQKQVHPLFVNKYKNKKGNYM